MRPRAPSVRACGLREEVSSRNSLDISSGIPVVPTETKPKLNGGDTEGRPFGDEGRSPGPYRRRSIGAASGLVSEIIVGLHPIGMLQQYLFDLQRRNVDADLLSPKAGRKENEDRCPSATCWDREFADSLLEEGGFEPLVPPQSQHNRGTGPMSPTASIRVGLVIPLANSISISVASGTSGSNPLSSSGESSANLIILDHPLVFYALASADIRPLVKALEAPLSPRIGALKEIRAKLRPEPAREPLPPRRYYKPPSKGRYGRRR
jgi:hypothetical protein